MPAPKDNIADIPTLEAAITQLDRADLLSAVAGLQLLPENTVRTVRLEALAYVVGSTGSRSSRKVSPHSPPTKPSWVPHRDGLLLDPVLRELANALSYFKIVSGSVPAHDKLIDEGVMIPPTSVDDGQELVRRYTQTCIYNMQRAANAPI